MTPSLSTQDVRTTALTADIEALVEGIPGWTPLDELVALATLVHASAGVPGDIVEVGSWCGRSSVVLAQAADEAGVGAVHCIDPFPDRDDWRRNPDGSFSFRTETPGGPVIGYTEQTVWGTAFADSLAPVYDRCRSTLEIFTAVVAARGLTHRVQVHRGTARSFVAAAPASFTCRLAFLDGDHGYDAVSEDIQLLAPLLAPGAWLCFDDAFTAYEGVDWAIRQHVLASPHYDACRQLTRKLFVARRKGA